VFSTGDDDVGRDKGKKSTEVGGYDEYDVSHTPPLPSSIALDQEAEMTPSGHTRLARRSTSHSTHTP
jgi:hypothetical protein